MRDMEAKEDEAQEQNKPVQTAKDQETMQREKNPNKNEDKYE